MFFSKTLDIWVALATIFCVSASAFHLPSNALSLETAENRFKIDLIDIKCDKNENGMHITIQFSQPFDGIIYSQGHFNNPKCRYVTAGEHEQSYNFVVPFDGCGSKPSCAICDSIDNILIIQQDEEVQGEFDAARKISCSRTGIEEEKRVFFKPFIVEMLDVVTVPTSHGGVDCWMDIQRGVYPKLTSIGEVIKIGEELTVLVYLRDQKNEYDLSVRNCWAYDNEDFDENTTGKVQLSDASGCTMKRKLFGSWRKTHETGSTGANLLLHNTLRAFKFPDESQVYLKCDIEICRGTCAEAICDADEINRVDCALDPLHEKCIKDKLIERPNKPMGFTTLASTKVYQPSSTPETMTRRPYAGITNRPGFDFSTTQRSNYISTTVMDQEMTTTFVCTPDSRDIRCIQPQFAKTTQKPEITTYKKNSGTYSKATSAKPAYDSFCKLYPNHKRCSPRITDDLQGNIEILTFKPPSPFATVKYRPTTAFPKGIPNEKADIFITTEASELSEQPLDCRGPILDVRCPNPTPTNTPPTYLPPSTTNKYVPSTITPRCYPGSLDPACIKLTTQKLFVPSVSSTTRAPICYPGSFDPRCTKPIASKISIPELTTTEKFNTEQPETTTYKPSTTRAPICYPGALDPRCPKIATTKRIIPSISTTAEVNTEIPITTRAPICYPGSLDPRCRKVEIVAKPTTRQPFMKQTTKKFFICVPGSNDVNCDYETIKMREEPPVKEMTTFIPSRNQITTKQPEKPICFLGSTHPECQKVSSTILTLKPKPSTTSIPPTTSGRFISTTRTPICYPGALDPRCPKITTTMRTIPSISTTPEDNKTDIPSTTTAPRCYPGSFDPACVQSTTKKVFVSSDLSTTGAPLCYRGSRDPACRKPKIDIPEITTTEKIITEQPETTTYKIVSTTRPPICYPGALDPRCPKIGTTERIIPTISTTAEVKTEIPTTIRTPICYPGSLDPRCSRKTARKPFETTSQVTNVPRISINVPSDSSTTRAPVCYPGALDPRCAQATKSTTKLIPSFNLITTTNKPAVGTIKPRVRCYPGSLDPACASKLVVPLVCGPEYLDPRCPNPNSTGEPATYLPPLTTPSYETRKPSVHTTTTQRIVPTVTDRLRTTETESPEITTKIVTTQKPAVTFTQRPIYTTTKQPISFPTITTRRPIVTSTSVPQFRCTPNSLDPRCQTFTTQKVIPTFTTEGFRTTMTESPEITTKIVMTQRPPVITTQRPTYTTTKQPFSTTTFTTRMPVITSTLIPQFRCTPGSLDSRCKAIITSTFVPSTTTESLRTTVTDSPETTTRFFTTQRPAVTTQRPIVTITQRPVTTTKVPFTFPTFSTTRRIISSPQPFTTRPPTKTTSTSTENILCYPGSTIEGCKQTFTTPSYCYPGSKDKRCPQLPPSFSTRQPATYLPPFPDDRLNRVKRSSIGNEQIQEIVKFSLSFKPFSLS